MAPQRLFIVERGEESPSLGERLYRYIKSVKRGGKLLCAAPRQLIREEWLGQYFPPKPVVIQFPVNDICNARCVMCHIWQRKRDHEITPQELRQILADPLFRRVRYVGMSGGEPTLRSDLPEIGRVLIETLPRLRGMGIITNALRVRTVVERILALAEIARAANVPFGINVSLDGIGADHDRNRGVRGNFAAAVEVIRTFQQQGLPVSVGCTLTPLNCYGADEVLEWCEQNHLQGWEFRLGVEIKRIYNEGYGRQHPFTPEQRFHLIMFFDKLVHHPQVDEAHREFYHSLIGQLAFGLPRKAGCDWRSRGVTLDTRGNISYCSVQSPILGSALKRSAWQLFKEGLPERRRILREHCDSCQHDLLGPPPARVMVVRGVDTILRPWRRQARKLYRWFNTRVGAFQAPRSLLPAAHNSPSTWQHVLVTGWYGTETAGDKAILGELLHFLRTYAPGCRITLTTLDRKVSRQTRLELTGLENVALVPMDRGHDPALIESVDAVIVGGGPLEEIDQMEHIWRMFFEANRRRKARILFGCGVGPLHTDRLRQMVGAILQMTTAGFLRDAESCEYAVKLGAPGSLGCACDPALAYLQRWITPSPKGAHEEEFLRIVGLVRANTREYIVDMTEAELKRFNARTAGQIAHILESACQMHQAKTKQPVQVDLLPMHALWVGGDDRIFNRYVARHFRNPETVRVERAYLPLETLLQTLSSANAAVAMRYHGHLFCMALGIPFLSIDYTGRPGKVHSLIRRIGYEPWSEEWRNIDTARAASRLQDLLEGRPYWSAYLRQQTDTLVGELYRTYTRVFDLPGVRA